MRLKHAGGCQQIRSAAGDGFDLHLRSGAGGVEHLPVADVERDVGWMAPGESPQNSRSPGRSWDRRHGVVAGGGVLGGCGAGEVRLPSGALVVGVHDEAGAVEPDDVLALGEAFAGPVDAPAPCVGECRATFSRRR